MWHSQRGPSPRCPLPCPGHGRAPALLASPPSSPVYDTLPSSSDFVFAPALSAPPIPLCLSCPQRLPPSHCPSEPALCLIPQAHETRESRSLSYVCKNHFRAGIEAWRARKEWGRCTCDAALRQRRAAAEETLRSLLLGSQSLYRSSEPAIEKQSLLAGWHTRQFAGQTLGRSTSPALGSRGPAAGGAHHLEEKRAERFGRGRDTFLRRPPARRPERQPAFAPALLRARAGVACSASSCCIASGSA